MPQLSAEVSGGAEGGKKRRQLWFHVGGAPGSVVVSAARPAVEHCGTLGGGAAWVLGAGRGVKRSASNLHILRYLLDIQGEMSIRI